MKDTQKMLVGNSVLNKGFTLIELLAVIVILAIIALIATPIILNIIGNTKDSADLRSAENYLTAATQAVSNYQLNNAEKSIGGTYNVMKNGNLCNGTVNNDICTGLEIKVQISGKKIMPESITFTENGDLTNVTGLNINGKDYTYENGSLKESTTRSTKTVYRWSSDKMNIGDIMDDSSKYTTDTSTLGKNTYLKHVLDSNNKIIESYTCSVYDSKEFCFIGGRPDLYGYAENEEKYTGNVSILKESEVAGLNCVFNTTISSCGNASSVYLLSADSKGNVSSRSDRGIACKVDADGSSYCAKASSGGND